MGIRNGQQYLESIRDEREVYLDGRRVADAGSDPGLAGAARTLAALYDRQHDPALRELLTAPDPDSGERTARAALAPRSLEEVRARGQAMKSVADFTCGMFGRTPDFMQAGIACLAAASEIFDESSSGRAFGANVRAYWQRVKRDDLTMTHVQINPQVDRSRQVFEQKHDIALKVVRETDAGFVVNGSRWVGTLAQLANEIVVMPSVVLVNDSKGEDYAMAFATPVATPGIKIISRPSVVPYGAGHFLDHPLSMQYDEGDAVVVFDQVFVPWERTFVYRDPDLCNRIYKRTFLSEHYSQQTMVRALAKAEFMAALAVYMARAVKVDVFPNVQGLLAEMLIFVEMQRALVDRAEAQAAPTPFGSWAPNKWPLHAAQLHFYERYGKMIDTVRAIGAGSLVGVPSYAETEGGIAELVDQYFASAGQGSQERIQLMRLAADAAMSAFSGRQAVYERYYQGDPVRRAAGFYMDYPKDDMHARIERLLAEHRTLAREIATDAGDADDAASAARHAA
jgi:4-hydroxyphenylacetate 3-monooxygenase